MTPRLWRPTPLTINRERRPQPGDSVLLRGLQAGKETWANMVSYEVIHPEDTDNNKGLVNITLKFGYNAPRPRS